MTDAISGALNKILRGQEAVRKTTAWIETFAVAGEPARRIYRVTGYSKDVVQDAITARMNAVEEAPGNGYATFENPWLQKDGRWCSVGEVITEQVPA